MSEKNVSLPGVSETSSTATEPQKLLLMKYNKWVDGMSFEEAKDAIDKLPKMDYPLPGIYLFKVGHIKMAKKKDGSDLIDKVGNPALEIKFRIKQGDKVKEILSNFYFRKNKEIECKAEWRIASLKTALGVALNESVSFDKIKDTAFWGGIKKVLLTNETGDVLANTDGSEKHFCEVMSSFWKYNKEIEGKGKPKMEGDPSDGTTELGGKFVETKVSTTQGKVKEQHSGTTVDDFAEEGVKSTVKEEKVKPAPSEDEWEKS
jgi:hypothetical protein